MRSRYGCLTYLLALFLFWTAVIMGVWSVMSFMSLRSETATPPITETTAVAIASESPVIIITTDNPQKDAIEIPEGPPIDLISEALDAADALDDCPYNDAVPLDRDLQKYIWEKCKGATPDYKNLYSFIIGLIDQESTFNPRAVSKTNDYGLCQTNKKWVFPDVKKEFGLSDITDCFDPYISVDCCFYELTKKLDSYGVSERLYYYYNTGKTSGSYNSNSRKMVKKWQKWDAVIWGTQ
ncbi:transglycosylase-like protein with SLT domain [Fusobacterium naviforme]|nr:transglycosylase SLT domain-containing protein [Fusobacterium naviforme]PSL09104.1 transglycosylase-like protein with SLT domain [Fusobacterium naviforme]STO27712.1 Transglycosylase SLT domain [Fusobacterium naviforme]